MYLVAGSFYFDSSRTNLHLIRNHSSVSNYNRAIVLIIRRIGTVDTTLFVYVMFFYLFDILDMRICGVGRMWLETGEWKSLLFGIMNENYFVFYFHLEQFLNCIRYPNAGLLYK